jgi:hypothetical protein
VLERKERCRAAIDPQTFGLNLKSKKAEVEALFGRMTETTVVIELEANTLLTERAPSVRSG